MPCVANTHQPDEGQPSCIACENNEHSEPGSVTCQPCASGRYSTPCRACPAGRFSASHRDDECEACAPGSITDTLFEAGATQCTACTPGQVSLVSTSDCETCRPGRYQDEEAQTSCIECEAGAVTDTLNGYVGTTCTECASGQISGDSTVACQACAAGQYQGGDDHTICQACGAGQYQAGAGEAFCVDCSAGSVTNTLASTGATECVGCAVGQASQASTIACIACEAGFYQDVAAQTDCIVCTPGSITSTLALSGAVSCTQCAAGRFSDSACQNCPPGSVTNTETNPVATSCAECAVGQASPVSIQGCQHCAPGEYQTDAGQTSCQPCAAAADIPPLANTIDMQHTPMGREQQHRRHEGLRTSDNGCGRLISHGEDHVGQMHVEMDDLKSKIHNVIISSPLAVQHNVALITNVEQLRFKNSSSHGNSPMGCAQQHGWHDGLSGNANGCGRLISHGEVQVGPMHVEMDDLKILQTHNISFSSAIQRDNVTGITNNIKQAHFETSESVGFTYTYDGWILIAMAGFTINFWCFGKTDTANTRTTYRHTMSRTSLFLHRTTRPHGRARQVSGLDFANFELASVFIAVVLLRRSVATLEYPSHDQTTFVMESPPSSMMLDRTDYSYGGVTADFSGDGIADVLVMNNGEANELLIGDGAGG
eukprot:SAG11_NODE_2891_length_2863_cov_3.092258_1_plen_654_part_10